MDETVYPKWVQRASDIGAVLCVSADEEKQLLDAWTTEKEAEAQAAVVVAKAEAAAAKEEAQVVLKSKGK